MARRRLTPRGIEVVSEIVDAAEVEADLLGYDGLTVRRVASRAGVAPATAYTYFSSKDHLLAELLWRRVRTVTEEPIDLTQPLPERIEVVLRTLGAITEGSAAVTGACTQALLSSNPDVSELQRRIGGEIVRRLAEAMGPEDDPTIASVLATTYFGALLSAGMGYMDYGDVAEFVVGAARLMSGD